MREIFALLTLAVTFALSAIAQLSTWVDGGQGIPIQIPDYPEFLGEYQDLVYRLGLAVAALAVLGLPDPELAVGWGLFSIRDEEDVAEGLGVPTFRYKMLAITISGFSERSREQSQRSRSAIGPKASSTSPCRCSSS